MTREGSHHSNKGKGHGAHGKVITLQFCKFIRQSAEKTTRSCRSFWTQAH